MNRENLIDRMIAVYGMEDPIVIHFARMCEDWASTAWNDKCLETLVKAHEACPVFCED